MRSKALVATLALVALAIGGCHDDSSAGGDTGTIAADNGGGGNDNGGGVDPGAGTPDTAVGVDPGPGVPDNGGTFEDIPIVPGGFGAPCQGNGDCDSGWCVDGPDGYVCTKTCDISCPGGFDCKSVTSGGSDIVFLCVPRFQKLCVPCSADVQCNGGACLTIGGEGQCSYGCDASKPNDCPDGFSCVADATGDNAGTFCQPVSGSCACTPLTVGSQRTCTATTDGIGTCTGLETCQDTPALGWGACSAATPAVEDCDGLDNDCDGLIDEELPVDQVCQNTVDGVGTCNGVNVCQGTNGWICQGPVPSAEKCDFQDNDCDGGVDEDFKSGDAYSTFDHCGTCNASCGVGFPNAATTACGVFGGQPQCVVETCATGYVKINDFQCLPDVGSICQPCAEAANCFGDNAACVALTGGTYCSSACDTVADCPSGYSCNTVPESSFKQCVPTSGSCSCDGTNTDLQRSCSETYTPADPNQPAYTCNGTEQCTASGWGGCVLPAEDCDGADNDCDGQVDEDFKDGAGDYSLVEHCGGCGISCLALGFQNSDPGCDTAGAVPQCSFVCKAGFFDVNGISDDGCECEPVAGDDLAGDGVDSNCDGIDGDVTQGVFVAKNGDDADPGTIDAPVRTIGQGLQRAADGNKRDVYVATGVYSENIILRDGVGVFGGYSSDFLSHDSVLFETAILGTAPTPSTPAAVTAVNLGNGGGAATVLDGFTIFGTNAANTAGENSYAVYLSGCGASLAVRNNLIFGNAGGNGASGDPGSDGSDGSDGAGGEAVHDTGDTSCGASDERAGGMAGANSCPGGVNVGGGGGGRAACPTGAAPAGDEAGADGSGPSAGSGGVAGYDGLIESGSCGLCSVDSGQPQEGGGGTAGGAGSAGTAGQGCGTPEGAVVAGHWSNAAGGSGVLGTNGGGGGGGGSGRGVEVASTSCSSSAGGDDIGGSGGGGGAGGCGGTGGTGGASGGGSFGIFLVYGSAPSAVPVLDGNVIQRGSGGQGGTGGPGGAGGLSGSGGAGGAPLNQAETFCALGGGEGGDGGVGGHGGGGGGGCGGASYGIFVWQAGGGVNVGGYKTGNTFVAGGASGQGGAGGPSLGLSGLPGQDGAAADTNF